MKSMEKYFLALIPEEEMLQKANDIKEALLQKFGVKYALKSPPHITLKMPFSYNEAKEDQLVQRIGGFLKEQLPISVKITGVGTFGNRVIFLAIEKSLSLEHLQRGLKVFCKTELNLVDELSDRNFHPHLTVAFKDLKPAHFSEILQEVRSRSFSGEFIASQLVLLKRIEGKWILHHKIPFAGDF
jgi:2'-5' RNA ligase